MPKVRLIDANALFNDLKKSAKAAREWREGTQDEEIKIRAEQTHGTFVECALRVKNAPTIEAEPVRHGRMIEGIRSDVLNADAIGTEVLTMADLIDRNAAIWILSDYAETQQDLDYYRDMLMEIPTVNRWISVEDALPEENEYVLAWVKRAHKSRVILSVLINGAWKIGVNDCSDGFNAVGKITHWMPLPEPPKEDET